MISQHLMSIKENKSFFEDKMHSVSCFVVNYSLDINITRNMKKVIYMT